MPGYLGLNYGLDSGSNGIGKHRKWKNGVDVEDMIYKFTLPGMNAIASKNRKCLSRRGGSICASLSSFNEIWI